MAAEQMPKTSRLRKEELERLEQLWILEKKKYIEAIWVDDGRYHEQHEVHDRMMATCRKPEMVRCWGPYCNGVVTWVYHSEIVRSKGGGNGKARCIACANLDKRLAKLEARRQEALADV